jgi:hypothetical protein
MHQVFPTIRLYPLSASGEVLNYDEINIRYCKNYTRVRRMRRGSYTERRTNHVIVADILEELGFHHAILDWHDVAELDVSVPSGERVIEAGVQTNMLTLLDYLAMYEEHDVQELEEKDGLEEILRELLGARGVRADLLERNGYQTSDLRSIPTERGIFVV